MTNSASSHWSAQRLSAIGLVFLSAFSFYRAFGFINSGQPLVNIFNMPFFLIALVLFIGIGLYHSYLGIEVIMEDYIACGIKRKVIGGAVKLLNLATITLLLITMFHGFSKTSNEEVIDTNIESAEIIDKSTEKIAVKNEKEIQKDKLSTINVPNRSTPNKKGLQTKN